MKVYRSDIDAVLPIFSSTFTYGEGSSGGQNCGHSIGMPAAQNIVAQDKCAGISGAIFGHSFEAIYSTRPPTPRELAEGFQTVRISLIKSITAEIYEGHVCTRCGKRVMKYA